MPIPWRATIGLYSATRKKLHCFFFLSELDTRRLLPRKAITFRRLTIGGVAARLYIGVLGNGDGFGTVNVQRLALVVSEQRC
ncbi:MAG: hypothetical protein AAF989_07390 [Planctomycetota bacterium]